MAGQAHFAPCQIGHCRIMHDPYQPADRPECGQSVRRQRQKRNENLLKDLLRHIPVRGDAQDITVDKLPIITKKCIKRPFVPLRDLLQQPIQLVVFQCVVHGPDPYPVFSITRDALRDRFHWIKSIMRKTRVFREMNPDRHTSVIQAPRRHGGYGRMSVVPLPAGRFSVFRS